MNKELKILDWLVGITFFLVLGTRLCTAFLLSKITEISAATMEQVAIAYEANPVARTLIISSGINDIITYLVVPSAVVAIYLIFRRMYKNKKITFEALSLYIYMLFLIFLQNFLNDFIILLGKIL